MLPSIEYISGFFDGEGCVGVYSHARRQSYRLALQITQNKSEQASDLFNALQTRFGGNVGEQKTSHGTKLNWQIGSEGAAALLEKMLPFLILKHQQARLALRWYRSRPPAQRNEKGHFVSNVREIDERVYLSLRILKKLPHIVQDEFTSLLVELGETQNDASQSTEIVERI